MKFIEVTETKYNEKVLINIENISHIFIQSNAIVMNGNHWVNEVASVSGYIPIEIESMEKLMKEINKDKNKEYKEAFKKLTELIVSCDFYNVNEHEKYIDLIDDLVEKANDWLNE